MKYYPFFYRILICLRASRQEFPSSSVLSPLVSESQISCLLTKARRVLALWLLHGVQSHSVTNRLQFYGKWNVKENTSQRKTTEKAWILQETTSHAVGHQQKQVHLWSWKKVLVRSKPTSIPGTQRHSKRTFVTLDIWMLWSKASWLKCSNRQPPWW